MTYQSFVNLETIALYYSITNALIFDIYYNEHVMLTFFNAILEIFKTFKKRSIILSNFYIFKYEINELEFYSHKPHYK